MRNSRNRPGNQSVIYFSEKEQGERPRTHEVIEEGAWVGIQALIRRRIEDGSFGQECPEICLDGGSQVIGTDENLFGQAVRGDIPAFVNLPWRSSEYDLPDTLDILDLIEFSWKKIGKPVKGRYHSHFEHYHLTFDIDIGRENFP